MTMYEKGLAHSRDSISQENESSLLPRFPPAAVSHLLPTPTLSSRLNPSDGVTYVRSSPSFLTWPLHPPRLIPLTCFPSHHPPASHLVSLHVLICALRLPDSAPSATLFPQPSLSPLRPCQVDQFLSFHSLLNQLLLPS